jgi:hypothetical protein
MRSITSVFLLFCACTTGMPEETDPDVAFDDDEHVSGSLNAQEPKSDDTDEVIVEGRVPITLIVSMTPFSDAYREHGYPREERVGKKGLARVAEAEKEADDKLATFVTDNPLSGFSANFRPVSFKSKVEEVLDNAKNARAVFARLEKPHTGIVVVFLSTTAWAEIGEEVFDKSRHTLVEKKDVPWVGVYLTADYDTHVTNVARRLIFDNVISLTLADLHKKLANISDFQKS